MSDIAFVFASPPAGIKRIKGKLLAEAELHFLEGSLRGLKLVGFSVWEGQSGRWVTGPARGFGSGASRRYFDYLRPVEMKEGYNSEEMVKLKDKILAAYGEYKGR